MGFAIPMATAEPILEELMNQKEVAANNQAYLGITGRDVTDVYKRQVKILAAALVKRQFRVVQWERLWSEWQGD